MPFFHLLRRAACCASLGLFHLGVWAQPQASQWTWMGGDTSNTTINPDQFGQWGQRGALSPGQFPSARNRAVTWTDAQGRFWLFGGFGFDEAGNNGFLNDLWRYDAALQSWVWVHGPNNINTPAVYGTRTVAASGNLPGARQGANGWSDAEGNLWLFGGQGYATLSNQTGFLNDLWMYNTTTGQWTWITGSNSLNPGGNYGSVGIATGTNTPGSRSGAASWTDASGTFWLFGGSSSTRFNDLWRFDAATRLWTWVSGCNCGDQRGAYGTRGIAAAGNIPGARQEAVGWNDAAGNFWVMGGFGRDANNNLSFLNDLWQFNTTTQQWTWYTGSNLVNQGGIYGNRLEGTAATTPGARSGAFSWTDAAGRLLLFGGTNGNLFNDIWRYDRNTGVWTWLAGLNAVNQLPEYGTAGVGTASNRPGARQQTQAWLQANGHLFMWGGLGLNATAATVRFNDSWNWNPDTQIWTWLQGSRVVLQPGVYGTLRQAVAESHPGGRRFALSAGGGEGLLWLFGGQGFAETGSPGFLNDLWSFDTRTQQWIWQSGSRQANATAVFGTRGVPAPNNVPGSRFAGAAWQDLTGRFWAFGGRGANGLLNDLWRYQPETGNWTWMAGSTGANAGGTYGTRGVANSNNTPSAREEASTWTDTAGNLWLFGGNGRTINGQDGVMHDLWMFSTATNQWTWMGGSAVMNVPPTFGTLGVSGTGEPGARRGALSWQTPDGTVWLLGGFGIDELGAQGNLNDLWRLNTTTLEWTWVGGSRRQGQNGSYPALPGSGAAGYPGARQSSVTWTDGNGHLWLLGGIGHGVSGAADYLQDLWRYDPQRNEWYWEGGSNNIFPPHQYGNKAQAAASNMPVARHAASGWTDAAGQLWFFGGMGRYNQTNTTIFYNDLWSYRPVCRVIPAFQLSSTQQCIDGNAFSVTNTSRVNGGTLRYEWSFGNGNGSIEAQPSFSFAAPGIYRVRLQARTDFCSDTAAIEVRVLQTPAEITISGPATVCAGTDVLLAANTGAALRYNWFLNNTPLTRANTSRLLAMESGRYTVMVTDTLTGCATTSAEKEILIRPLPPVPSGVALQEFCNEARVAQLQASGNGLRWYATAAGGVPLADNILLTNGAVYYASQTAAGCESADRLAVQVQLRAVAPPTGNGLQLFCNSATVGQLAAAGTGIRWYTTATGGMPLDAGTLLASGTRYYASQTAAGCESVQRLVVQVLVNRVAPPAAAGTQSFCGGATIDQLVASGSGIRWYANPAGGNTLAAGTILQNNTTYYAAQLLDGCESAERLPILVQIQAAPAAPTGTTNQSFCSGARVTDLAANGTNLRWYTTATGGNSLSPATVLVQGGVYYASQQPGVCESAQRFAVTVALRPTPPQPQISINGFELISSAATGNQWFRNGVPLAGATAQRFRPLEPGGYQVQITVDGCTSTLSETLQFISGGGEYLRLQPNPVRNQFQVMWLLRQHTTLLANLYNSQGVLVQQLGNLQSGALISVAGLQPGVYLLQLLPPGGKQAYLLRLVKQ